MIDRYDIEHQMFSHEASEMIKGGDGDYVLYTDHEAALRAICDALRWYVTVYSDQAKYSKSALEGQVNAIKALRMARGE